MDYVSDSESEDHLQQDLLYLKRALGSAYRNVASEVPETQHSKAPASVQPHAKEQEAAEAIDTSSGQYQSTADSLELAELVSQRDAMQAALNANRALQKQLQIVKEHIEKFHHDNGIQAVSIKQLRTNPSAGKGEHPEGAGSSTMGHSRFWVQGSTVPIDNVDTVALLPYYTYLPHRFEHPRRWTIADCDNFKAAILTVVKTMKYEAGQTLREQDTDASDVDALTLASPGVQESIKSWTDDFWEKRITSNNGIPGTECRVHWFNHCCPAVNHAPWSSSEEAQLLELVEQNKKLNWEQVAAKLDTGRPAVACMMHFKGIEQRSRGQGRFQPDEEQRIEAAVRLYGPNWGEVASHCGGGRSRQQVMHHYKNTMKPSRKGKWSPQEDDLLLQAVAVVGKKRINRWSTVAEMVGSRGQIQCRERYCNVLDPELKSGPWSEEEIALLKAAVLVHTREDGCVKWAAVAAQLPGRTDNEVARQHTKMLFKEQDKAPSRKRFRPAGAGAQTSIQASAAMQASATTIPEAAASSAAQPQVGHRPKGLSPSTQLQSSRPTAAAERLMRQT
ncbi:TPA: hypothetical protein ACH3X2_013950 [Trebouxia sp. C0005]